MPERLLDLELHQGRVTPRYLTTRDHLWVEGLAERLEACVGQSRAEVEQRLGHPPGWGERRLAYRAMLHLSLRARGFEVRSCLPPPRLRQELFDRAAAVGPHRPRGEVLALVAEDLGIDPAALEQDLYADLPERQVLRPLPPEQARDVPFLIERYNLALAQGILLRAESLQVRVAGGYKAVVRFAKLQRLLCRVEAEPGGAALLHLDGPLSLFHHTTKYGRAMARWLPVLVRVPRWELWARCVVRKERAVWRASFHDPLGTTHAPVKKYDSELEARFVRDMTRMASSWQVLREADPLQIDRHVLCPDFTLVDERRGLRLPVELVGFWTPQYLEAKLDLLRRLPPETPWLICIDESLAAARGNELPDGATLFRFRRVIDVEAFVAFVERWVKQGVAGDR